MKNYTSNKYRKWLDNKMLLSSIFISFLLTLPVTVLAYGVRTVDWYFPPLGLYTVNVTIPANYIGGPSDPSTGCDQNPNPTHCWVTTGDYTWDEIWTQLNIAVTTPGGRTTCNSTLVQHLPTPADTSYGDVFSEGISCNNPQDSGAVVICPLLGHIGNDTAHLRIVPYSQYRNCIGYTG